MEVYKLTQTYPGSPKVGEIITSAQTEYYSIKPNEYPEFWELQEREEFIVSKDGVKLYEGDIYFYISEYLDIRSNFLRIKYHTPGKLIFSSEETAEANFHSKITVNCEDGDVEGENIPLYTVLTKAQWQTDKTTSLEAWKRTLDVNKCKLNPSWLYFRSEEARDEYREMNRPKYSQKDLDDALYIANFPDTWYLHDRRNIFKISEL